MRAKTLPFFDRRDFLAEAGQETSVVTYHKNDVIFAQGDTADAIFYVRAGQVRLTVVSQRGKEAVIAVLRAGDFFGEACLAGQPQRIATACAVSECSVIRLEKHSTARVLHEEAPFADVFLRYVLTRSIRMEADLVDHLFNSSEKRLARLLLLLANCGEEGRLRPMVPRISQETLAEMIGTTRPRVSFFMNKFRRMGLISYSGGIEKGVIEIHGGLRNVVLHD